MTKLCPRGKAAAKRKFKVYPSAYANAYASKICAGKIKDPSGTKRKDFRGPKPAGAKKGALMIIIGVGKKKKVDKKMGGGMTAGSMSGMGRLQKARMMKEGGRSVITRGGGVDSSIIGRLRDIGAKGGFKPIPTTPPGGFGPVSPDRRKRLKKLIDKRSRKEKITSAIKKGISAASPATGAITNLFKITKKVRSKNRPERAKPAVGRTGSKKRPIVKDHSSRNPNPKTPKMNKGGMADYYKDLM